MSPVNAKVKGWKGSGSGVGVGVGVGVGSGVGVGVGVGSLEGEGLTGEGLAPFEEGSDALCALSVAILLSGSSSPTEEFSHGSLSVPLSVLEYSGDAQEESRMERESRRRIGLCFVIKDVFVIGRFLFV